MFFDDNTKNNNNEKQQKETKNEDTNPLQTKAITLTPKENKIKDIISALFSTNKEKITLTKDSEYTKEK